LESVPQVEPEAQAPVDEEKAENDAAADISAEVQPSEAPEAFKKEAPEEIPPDGPSADPKLVVPPSADDTGVPANTPPPATVALEEPKRPQVVHLPPQEVQEARLKEREKHLEQTVREQERKEDERLAIPVSNTHTDLVSSPSSTIGPYSQATPHATHQSPDTSPDGESFVGRVAQSIEEDLEPDPAARQAKEEHERALQKQMQEARERARGDDSATPEVERQLEEEQAIRLARDGKSRLSESDPTPVVHSLTEHAEDVVRDLSPRPTDAEAAKSSLERRVEPMPTPTIAVPEPSGLEVTNADTVPENRQRPTPATVEHPTPPADVDVEMDDAAPAVKERPATPRPAEPSPQECPATPAPSEVIMQKSTSGLNGDVGLEKAMPTPRSSNVSASPPRPSPRKKKSNEVSTVIFAKRDPQKYLKALQLYNPDYAALQGASEDPSRDYLQALFQYQAHHAPRSLPLSELVSSARKTVSTGGVLAMLREVQDYKILKRVYHLQNANRWSLRQLQKSAEPPRPSSHLDHLLREMKWLQTDFKEERKWKKALAATFAEWCAEYVNSSPEEQASLRIRARAPSHRERLRTGDDDMLDAPTPDLVHSGANETESESFADDEELFSQSLSKAPAGLFSLGFNDVVVKLDSTPATDAMLLELPAYEPNLEGSSDVTPVSFCDPPILPVSKFVTGKLVSKVTGPPRKRSRYEYDSEDEPTTPPSRSGTSAEHSMPSTPGRRLFHRNDLPPELTDVALFNPDNKHVRDRLYAAHQFKPPSEFPMPSVSFFENRTSSQWLWSEDQQLRALVKEYAFNWSLVAQELSQPSKFVSGAGRRTPWECFERWVQLEGLPSDMGKTPYFRTYQTRLEQAQRTVVAQHQAQQQLLQSQAQQGQNVSGQARRRVTHPIRVERRRDNRHLAIIDGMRKLAKRREQQAHKQSEGKVVDLLKRLVF
jgi:chromatin modification-related protein VID21